MAGGWQASSEPMKWGGKRKGINREKHEILEKGGCRDGLRENVKPFGWPDFLSPLRGFGFENSPYPWLGAMGYPRSLLRS
jgi:hypothetical protein